MDSVFSLANLTRLGPLDILLWPMAATVLGGIIWILGCRYEEDDGSPLVKWLCVPPIVFALIQGLITMLKVVGSSVDAVIYRDAIGGKRMLIAHYGAFILPFLVAVGIVVWFTVRRRQDRI